MRRKLPTYAHLENRLSLDYALQLNTAKTTSGRFASTKVDYCGWSFAGGYARISEDKVLAFKERMRKSLTGNKKLNIHTLIKRVNRKIDGFGHYYKQGDVRVQFNSLDIFTRSLLRAWLCRHYSNGRYDNTELARLGLRSLFNIKQRHTTRTCPTQSASRVPPPLSRTSPHTATQCTHIAPSSQKESHRAEELLFQVTQQLKEQIALQRSQIKLLKTMIAHF